MPRWKQDGAGVVERAGRVGTLPGVHTLGASGHNGTTVGMRYVCRAGEMQSGMCGQVARVDSLNMPSRRLAQARWLSLGEGGRQDSVCYSYCPWQREPQPAPAVTQHSAGVNSGRSMSSVCSDTARWIRSSLVGWRAWGMGKDGRGSADSDHAARSNLPISQSASKASCGVLAQIAACRALGQS